MRSSLRARYTPSREICRFYFRTSRRTLRKDAHARRLLLTADQSRYPYMVIEIGKRAVSAIQICMSIDQSLPILITLHEIILAKALGKLASFSLVKASSSCEKPVSGKEPRGNLLTALNFPLSFSFSSETLQYAPAPMILSDFHVDNTFRLVESSHSYVVCTT